ncbi:hypothetical protein FACS189440_18630 [Bacteroidia bacterium]|nr:hypothetical protein FACS189440_18630 [Bacteroidia bacterium]
MTYTYHIRNWLKKIDCPHVFTETLYYEESYAGNTPLYNGNISATAIDNGFWYNNLPPEDEDVAFYPAVHTGYNYQYDGLNRLKKSQSTENGRINDLFNEEFTYDKQGNILTLKRNFLNPFQSSSQHSLSFQTIDDLTMEYTGNQLKKVQEAVPASRPYGFVRPSGNPENEYAYDRNGAMTKDFNRGIENISYNVLNLPNKIYFTGLNSTQYSYDAMGVKRRTIHTTVENRTLVALQPQPVVPLAAEATTFSIPVNRHIRAGIIKVSIQPSTTQTVTDYCGNIVYENGELKYILNPEGYAYKTGNDIRYDYYLRDHLGNNWKAGNQINNYYPSGMVNSFISSNSERQPYKFGNKELDEMHGLNTYDQVTRQFGTIIPVTPTMDLLAEKNYSTSPYSQYGNNPVNYIDPDGREVSFSYEWEKDKDGNYIINEQTGGYNLIGVTMNVTGKVINVSSNSKVDMQAATDRISNQIESSFSGDMDGVKFSTNVNLSVANSMDDVSDSDHVFALADISGFGKYGASNTLGGKVDFIDADYFTGWYDTSKGNQGPRTATHEFGHLLGLTHVYLSGNLMVQGGGGTYVTQKQLGETVMSYNKGYLNQGNNYEFYNGKKMPNRGEVRQYIKYKK